MNEGSQLNKESGVSDERGVPAEQGVGVSDERGVSAEQGVGVSDERGVSAEQLKLTMTLIFSESCYLCQ